jgi:N-acetylmuramoyl-L-alanine amidase
MKKSLRIIALALTAALCWGCFAVSGIAENLSAGDAAPIVSAGESDFAGNHDSDFAPPATPAVLAPAHFLPNNMRGTIISPEVDFLLSPDDTSDDVIAQLDDIFTHISDIGLNTVMIKTSVGDRKYYDLDMNRNGTTDFIKLAVEQAHSRFFHVYLIYDIGHALNFDINEEDPADVINRFISEAHRLTIKYPCDGIILDNFYNDPGVNTFTRYMRGGAGIGYENWLYDSTEFLFETAAGVVRMTDNTIPVGVMINDMWANESAKTGGSPTRDSVQAYFDGFADTKKYIERGYADFVLLRCYGSLNDGSLPFEASAQWWGELCDSSGIPLYLIHYNENIGNGWPEDQILRQLKVAREGISAYSGSVFNSYQALKRNTLNSAGTLKTYFAGLIDEESLMQDLVMHSPRDFNFTTFEPTVNFMGTFDRNFDVYFNNSRIELNEAGNFFFEEALGIGANTFTLSHKGRTYTYRIDRRIIVMREIDSSISDGRVLRVDGGTAITLNAVAYKGATVTATINGQTVRLQEQAGTLLDEDVNSAYTNFTGRYRVPDGIIGVEQPLGQITVQASYSGQSSTFMGAQVFVNAEPEPPPVVNFNPIMYDESSLGDGEVVGRIGAVRNPDESLKLVRLNNNNTHVFDARTTGTVFNPMFGQLPAGTLDYYRSDVGGFYTTESGKRFRADDVALIDGYGIGENALFVRSSGTSGGNSFFEIVLDTRISYNVEASGISFFDGWGSEYNVRGFDSEYIFVTFDNVTSVTKLPSFESNLVFSSGKWEQVTIDGVVKFRLVLRLRTQGVYAGNSAYYSANGNLILTFPVLTNNLSGMTIVIDPGHGINANGFDPGAIGHITEFSANLAVAKLLESKFNNLGANAIRLRTEDVLIPARDRPIVARERGADIFISLHSNRVSGNPDARGTEVFYYTPFSQPLASAISESIAGYFTNNVYSDGADKNRGAKNSYFWVTVQQDFPSVLVEMGFVSNYEDAMALANETHQDGIADAIVRGVQRYLSRSQISQSPDGSVTIPDVLIPEDPVPDPEPEPEPVPEPEPEPAPPPEPYDDDEDNAYDEISHYDEIDD